MPYLKLTQIQVNALMQLYDVIGRDGVDLETIRTLTPPLKNRTFGNLITKGYVCIELVGRWSDFKYKVLLTEKGLHMIDKLKGRAL